MFLGVDLYGEAMNRKLAKHIPKPPTQWWNRFDPVYVSIPLVVAAVCVAREPGLIAAGLGLTAIVLLFGYAWLRR